MMAIIIAKKKVSDCGLRSTVLYPTHALVPQVEVHKGSDRRQRKYAEKHEPAPWLSGRFRFEDVWRLQHAIRYGLA
jgi:hypothetical protein